MDTPKPEHVAIVVNSSDSVWAASGPLGPHAAAWVNPPTSVGAMTVALKSVSVYLTGTGANGMTAEVHRPII